MNKCLVKSKNISLSVIKEAVQRGNGAVRSYHHKLRHDFPVGTVGIVFGINDNYLVMTILVTVMVQLLEVMILEFLL